VFDPFFPLILLGAALAFFALLRVQKRVRAASLPRMTGSAIMVALWILFAAGSAYLTWPLLFLGPDNPNTSIYVQVPRGQAVGAFNRKLAAILQKQGLYPNSNSISSPEDPQNPAYVLEAQSVFTRVWSQTLPLSRDEALACGYKISRENFTANDERQYVVAVTSIPFLSGRAQSTFGNLKQQLIRSGYGVSSTPLPCQPAA